MISTWYPLPSLLPGDVFSNYRFNSVRRNPWFLVTNLYFRLYFCDLFLYQVHISWSTVLNITTSIINQRLRVVRQFGVLVMRMLITWLIIHSAQCSFINIICWLVNHPAQHRLVLYQHHQLTTGSQPQIAKQFTSNYAFTALSWVFIAYTIVKTLMPKTQAKYEYSRHPSTFYANTTFFVNRRANYVHVLRMSRQN